MASAEVVKLSVDDSEEVVHNGGMDTCYSWIAEHHKEHENVKFYVKNLMVSPMFQLKERFVQSGSVKSCCLANAHRVCRLGELNRCDLKCVFAVQPKE